jgi:hypothetical protein
MIGRASSPTQADPHRAAGKQKAEARSSRPVAVLFHLILRAERLPAWRATPPVFHVVFTMATRIVDARPHNVQGRTIGSTALALSSFRRWPSRASPTHVALASACLPYIILLWRKDATGASESGAGGARGRAPDCD